MENINYKIGTKVIMKKEKGKWIIVRVIGDYIYS